MTLAVSITFLTQLDLSRYGNVVLGLVLGGALAAPIAGYLVKIMPPRLLLLMVGTVSGGERGGAVRVGIATAAAQSKRFIMIH